LIGFWARFVMDKFDRLLQRNGMHSILLASRRTAGLMADRSITQSSPWLVVPHATAWGIVLLFGGFSNPGGGDGHTS